MLAAQLVATPLCLTLAAFPQHPDTKEQKTFGFVAFAHEESSAYACRVLNTVVLFGRVRCCDVYITINATQRSRAIVRAR